ncbi:MAG TPA: ABC transporter permease [Cyclobacteriaceae bacterium]|nr:ABC transporter permease [Cyclobacteriaceae bacterium]
MRTLRFLLRKEFGQIFRNKAIVAMILVVPVVQLLILPLAANYEVKNINLAIVDNDHSTYSQKLVSKITASGYFKLTGYNASFNEALELIESDQADLILEIPSDFEKNLVREDYQKIFLAVNAINGVKAGVGGSYIGSIIRDFNSDIRFEQISIPKVSTTPVIEIVPSNWFNVHMNYRNFMVPGILAVLLTMIGGYLSALNIVKEKEIGTIEQINVTPIKKHHFILGKLIPFWVLGLIVFTLGLIVSWLVYGIKPEGSLLLLYCFIAIYLLAVLGFGLLISTFTDTQQQAMFIAFFFMMIFILMSGLFTSIDSMPEWAKMIAKLNPVTYMIDVMRMIILKGSGFDDIKFHLLKVAGFAVLLNSWAILKYQKSA